MLSFIHNLSFICYDFTSGNKWKNTSESKPPHAKPSNIRKLRAAALPSTKSVSFDKTNKGKTPTNATIKDALKDMANKPKASYLTPQNKIVNECIVAGKIKDKIFLNMKGSVITFYC